MTGLLRQSTLLRGTLIAVALLVVRVGRAESDPAPPSPSPALDLIMSSSEIERVKLPSHPDSVQVESLRARVLLKFDRERPGPARRWTRILRLCPTAQVEGSVVALGCTTGRLDASIVQRNGASYLDVRELRGLPWRGLTDALPLAMYDPSLVGLGGACPGTTEAGKAECLLRAGRQKEAKDGFWKAVSARSEMPFAEMRLGDLALQESGITDAMHWYQSVPPAGPTGRLTAARMCEVGGSCLVLSNMIATFDSQGLSDPQRTEMDLRRIRVLALTGQWREALHDILIRQQETDRPAICGGAEVFCRSFLLAAFDHLNGADLASAIESFLLMPDHTKGPLAVELALAAAHATEALGARRSGAMILAAVTKSVPASQLDDYLRETARLFLAAGEQARAQVVIEFAQEQLGPRVTKSRIWTGLSRAAYAAPYAGSGGVSAESKSEAGDASDLARAAAAVASAQARFPGAAVDGSSPPVRHEN